MKKIVAIILAMAMVSGLCACNKNKHEVDYVPPTGNDITLDVDNSTEIVEPTDEEYAALWIYYTVATALHNNEYGISFELRDENGNYRRYTDQEALQYCVEKLPELECVDKWTEFGMANYENWDPSWDRKELLDSIIILEDVLIKQERTATDAVGNVEWSGSSCFEYDSAGNMLSATTARDGVYPYWPDFGWSIENQCPYNMRYFYNEDGSISKINSTLYDGTIKYVITPSYDETGRKIKDTSLSQEGEKLEYLYTYDSDGRLVSVTYTTYAKSYIETKYDFILNYSYDENGNIVEVVEDITKKQSNFEKQWHDKNIITYEYSADNKLVKWTDNNSLRTAVLDDLGRVLTWTSTSSNDGFTVETKQIYGDYYVLQLGEQAAG